MEAYSHNNSIADHYMIFLKNLKPGSKRDLISKLSRSLEEEKKPGTSLQSLFGSYESEDTAEEIIESIRNSKVFNRSIENF